MTAAERAKNILLSAKLGPLTPFFGIVNGQCECGKPKSQKHKPGKHPHGGGWQHNNATSDHPTIALWIGQYPNANFAVVTGIHTVVLDLDVRPGKDGVAELAAIEAKAGQALPATVTVFRRQRDRRTASVLQSSTRFGTAPEAKGTTAIDFQRTPAPIKPPSAPKPPETGLLNEHQVAKFLQLSVASVRRWRLFRTGPKYLKIGAAVRYRREDIEDWLSSAVQG